MTKLVNLQRADTEDARQFACRILKLSILELLLCPGVKLNEAELASSLAMSRTPVHDILVRLARENLVNLIPQRGAYVMCIDAARAKQSAQMHTQMGMAMLDAIYTKHLPASAYEPLNRQLTRLQFCVATRDDVEAMHCVNEFYKTLYDIADLDLVWSSLQYASSDLIRLMLMCCELDGFGESTCLECRAIIDALKSRNNTAACHALEHHFERIYAALPTLRQAHSQFFC